MLQNDNAEKVKKAKPLQMKIEVKLFLTTAYYRKDFQSTV